MAYAVRFRAFHVVIGIALCASRSRVQGPSDFDITTRVDESVGRMASLGYTGGVLVVRDGHAAFQQR